MRIPPPPPPPGSGEPGSGRERFRREQEDGFLRLQSGHRSVLIAPIASADSIACLPASLRMVLENLVRRSLLGEEVSGQIDAVLGRIAGATVSLRPSRVLLDGASDLCTLVDMASLRDAVAAAGGNAADINPAVPVDLLTDTFASGGTRIRTPSGQSNERREFLGWCCRSFRQLRCRPRGVGGAGQHEPRSIDRILRTERRSLGLLAYPEMIVSSDPGITAVNGLGLLGWGAGGLELQAILLGKPMSLALPQVVGIELVGSLPADTRTCDLALILADALRELNVDGKFVEFFGPGVRALSGPDRMTLAGMASDCGATCLYFPMDPRTFDHLRQLGATGAHLRLTADYAQLQDLLLRETPPVPDYDAVRTLDLNRVPRSITSPRQLARQSSAAASARERKRCSDATSPTRGPLEDSRRSEEKSRLPDDGSDPGIRFPWRESSMVLSRAPVFDALTLSPPGFADIVGMRPLAILGDSVTAEDISPSGKIALGTPAADFLLQYGIAPGDLGCYQMRRGCHEVALRATFASPGLRNALARGREGCVTRLMPEGVVMRLFDAACEYQRRGVPLLIIAGGRYGCGTGNDWAAKGVAQLGVRAILASSFDRIHRQNLIGAGVLPLLFPEKAGAAALPLDGSETFDLLDLDWRVGVRTTVTCIVRRGRRFWSRAVLRAAIETTEELYTLRQGGMLPALWREHLAPRNRL